MNTFQRQLFVMQINHTTKIINSLENERGSSHIKRRGWPTMRTIVFCDLTGIWKLQHLWQLKLFYLRNVTFYGMLDQPWTTRRFRDQRDMLSWIFGHARCPDLVTVVAWAFRPQVKQIFRSHRAWLKNQTLQFKVSKISFPAARS